MGCVAYMCNPTNVVKDVMSVRVQVILDEEERERYRRLAEREGLSLSAWFREAARERMRASETAREIRSVEDLRQFFEDCDTRERGREPEWEEHLEVIEESVRRGSSRT